MFPEKPAGWVSLLNRIEQLVKIINNVYNSNATKNYLSFFLSKLHTF